MKLWIGTSGFQYPAWKGGFYPDKISLPKMLPYYAERFTSTEINYTFRHLPSAKSIASWSAATPAAFRFSFKALQRITHFAKLKDCAELLVAFQRAIEPMGEKQGAVLFQLPPTFKKDVPLLEDFTASLPVEWRSAFEFRHSSWFADDVYATLRDHNVGLCLAEDEKLATPQVVTADFGCLRLRREDYTEAEIGQWAKYILAQREHWREAFVYFKHEDTGVGPRFAQQMLDIVAREERSGG